MLGRFFGWFILGLAFLAASADAVLALGATGYDGLATGEVLTLLAGQNPFAGPLNVNSLPGALATWLMQLPAWIVMGVTGLSLLLLSRRRPKKTLFLSAAQRRRRRG